MLTYAARVAKVLRVPVTQLERGELELDRETARYVQRVHRLRPGAALELFDPERGVCASAVLLEGARVRADAAEQAAAPELAGVTLLQALGKGDKLDRVVAAATALGAGAVTAVATERAVVRLDAERAAARRERWRQIAVQTARQCGRASVPQLAGPLPLEEVLRGEGPAICLDGSGEAQLARVLDTVAGASLRVLVGPEGGFTDRELERARAAGFVVARFGSLTLRTELAAAGVLGALLLWATGAR